MKRHFELNQTGCYIQIVGHRLIYVIFEYIETNPYGTFSVEFSLS